MPYLDGPVVGARGTCNSAKPTSLQCVALDSSPVLIQVDGEPAGRLPAEFRIVADALTLAMPDRVVFHAARDISPCGLPSRARSRHPRGEAQTLFHEPVTMRSLRSLSDRAGLNKINAHGHADSARFGLGGRCGLVTRFRGASAFLRGHRTATHSLLGTVRSSQQSPRVLACRTQISELAVGVLPTLVIWHSWPRDLSAARLAERGGVETAVALRSSGTRGHCGLRGRMMIFS